MKNNSVVSILVALVFFVLAESAMAIPYSNPAPADLGDDLDGSGLFTHFSLAVTLKIHNLFPAPPVGSTFGFFKEGSDTTDPTNLTTIFDSFDGIGDAAVIDFGSGVVTDFESSLTQDTFSPFLGNLGFFLSHPLITGGPVFTVASLNPGGLDLSATFPLLASPTDVFAIGFFDPSGTTLATLELVVGVTPAPVPEPSTLLLLGTGLASLAIYGKKRRKT